MPPTVYRQISQSRKYLFVASGADEQGDLFVLFRNKRIAKSGMTRPLLIGQIRVLPFFAWR